MDVRYTLHIDNHTNTDKTHILPVFGGSGPYLNDLSACSIAHSSGARRCTQGVSESTFASLTKGKRSARPGAWSKRVVPIL